VTPVARQPPAPPGDDRGGEDAAPSAGSGVPAPEAPRPDAQWVDGHPGDTVDLESPTHSTLATVMEGAWPGELSPSLLAGLLEPPARPLPSILVTPGDHGTRPPRVVVPRPRDEADIVAGLLEDLDWCDTSQLSQGGDWEGGARTGRATAGSAGGPPGGAARPCDVQRGQAAAVLLDSLQAGRVSPGAVLQAGGLGVLLSALGALRGGPGQVRRAEAQLRWRVVELTAELAAHAPRDALQAAVAAAGGAGRAADLLVRCVGDCSPSACCAVLRAEGAHAVFDAPLFSAPTVDAAARALSGLLRLGPAGTLDVLSRPGALRPLLDGVEGGFPHAAGCAALLGEALAVSDGRLLSPDLAAEALGRGVRVLREYTRGGGAGGAGGEAGPGATASDGAYQVAGAAHLLAALLATEAVAAGGSRRGGSSAARGRDLADTLAGVLAGGRGSSSGPAGGATPGRLAATPLREQFFALRGGSLALDCLRAGVAGGAVMVPPAMKLLGVALGWDTGAAAPPARALEETRRERGLHELFAEHVSRTGAAVELPEEEAAGEEGEARGGEPPGAGKTHVSLGAVRGAWVLESREEPNTDALRPGGDEEEVLRQGLLSHAVATLAGRTEGSALLETRLAAAELLWGAAAADRGVRQRLAEDDDVHEGFKVLTGLDLRLVGRAGPGKREYNVSCRLLACVFMLIKELAAESGAFSVRIAESATLPLTVAVLQTSGDDPRLDGLAQVQAAACTALRAMAAHSDPQLYIVAAGAVPALMRIVRDQVGRGAAAQACTALAELAREHGVIRRQLARAGVVWPLVELLATGNLYDQAHAATALEAMSTQADTLLDIEQAGVAPILLEVLSKEAVTTVEAFRGRDFNHAMGALEGDPDLALVRSVARWVTAASSGASLAPGATLVDAGDHRWQVNDLTERLDVEGFRMRNMLAFSGTTSGQDAADREALLGRLSNDRSVVGARERGPSPVVQVGVEYDVFAGSGGVVEGYVGLSVQRCTVEEWGLLQWAKVKCALLIARLAEDARLRITIGRMGVVEPLAHMLAQSTGVVESGVSPDSPVGRVMSASQAAASMALLAIGKNNRHNKALVARELAWYTWAGKRARVDGL